MSVVQNPKRKIGAGIIAVGGAALIGVQAWILWDMGRVLGTLYGAAIPVLLSLFLIAGGLWAWT
ncbi:MAG: hypothetical protein SV377_05930, partial [Halobacteria archaeon]|nr:hypothetical protein [Halobacteria archaeon]